jgi:hypothetical protein
MAPGPKFTDDWTEPYYQSVQDYFWDSALIGRKPIDDPSPPSGKEKDLKGWNRWEQRLRRLELPLNHILTHFFALAPQQTVDDVLTALVGAPTQGFRLVSEVEHPEGTYTQPDFVFANDSELLFLEMKIDTPSSVDQFAKYALSGEKLRRLFPSLQRVRLAMLVKDGETHRVWGSRNIPDEATLRAVAVSGVRGENGVWKQQGLQTHLSTASPEDRDRLVEQIESMPISISTYSVLARRLSAHVAPDPTAAKLIAGVLAELKRRNLDGT